MTKVEKTEKAVKKEMTKLSDWAKTLRTSPWFIIVIVAALAAYFLPIWPDGLGGHTTMQGYVVAWLGRTFKVVSGGLAGFWFSRHVLRLNVSAYPATGRPMAALSQAFIVGMFALGVCLGT